jgi:hypothetical protein
MNPKGTINTLLSLVLFVGTASILAQTSVPLPGKLTGSYQDKARRAGKMAVIPVELTDISTDGEKVSGIVSNYRSPAGNCISDNTPFKGTYKDGLLNAKSEKLKSQFADNRPCGGIGIELKLSGGNWHGTLTAGGDAFILDLDGK